MCRLFGLLSSRPRSAEDWLVNSGRSLLLQSAGAANQLQSDGWGVAWLDGARTVRLEKGTGGAHEPAEIDRFRSVAARARGTNIVAHLRKASNPMGLPRERLIALENSQPFVHGETIFAHNGMIPFPRETRGRLGRYEREVRGVNDSEVLFLLLMRHLEETDEPLTAYRRTAAELTDVWRSQGSPGGGPYSGLNVLLGRGPRELWAFCLSLGDHGTGLLDERRPYYELAYRSDPTRLLVGSEPFESPGGTWRSLTNGRYLVAEAQEDAVSVRTGSISIPSDASSGSPGAVPARV